MTDQTSTSRHLTDEQRETTTRVLRSYADYLHPAPDFQEAAAEIHDVANAIERTSELPADGRAREVVTSTFNDSGLDYYSSGAPVNMLDVLRDLQLPKYPDAPAAAAAPATEPTSDLDALYRVHLDEPGQLLALGSEYDRGNGPAPTVASEQRRTGAFV